MADMESDDEGSYDSDDTWESDLESEAEIAEIMQLDIAEDTSNTGKKEYLAKCSELKIVPIAMFIAKLDCEHINLRHHGMGVKGALAISSALLVNSQIRSLNLGDNWLKDDGTHALAQVFAHNTALTSINLSDNRIGLPGILSLCQQLQVRRASRSPFFSPLRSRPDAARIHLLLRLQRRRPSAGPHPLRSRARRWRALHASLARSPSVPPTPAASARTTRLWRRFRSRATG